MFVLTVGEEQGVCITENSHHTHDARASSRRLWGESYDIYPSY